MTEKELLDKCDLCGLKQTFPHNTGDLFPSLSLLVEKGIIKDKFPRKIYVCIGRDAEHREDFCLISHPSWSNKEKKCGSWQLDVDLSKGDSLSINFASEMRDMAKRMEHFTVLIIICTIMSLILTIVQMYLVLGQ